MLPSPAEIAVTAILAESGTALLQSDRLHFPPASLTAVEPGFHTHTPFPGACPHTRRTAWDRSGLFLSSQLFANAWCRTV